MASFPTEHLKGIVPFVCVADAGGFTAAAERLNLRISVMVIRRFGERDQFGRWCCAVNG
ncbi:helix-turn-helix domain-containing protein, partial [Burkholderia multivorans]|uniref:helix-turn-helix domain-containing protein n=1 Tax=Burkholderia multivorans TaxID=87883 RepID=UPI0035BE69ED